MDVDADAAVDELYGLAPGDFTAARDECATAARRRGDRALARRIGRLRRPTLAAWASNLLVRERPREVASLLQLGEALRRAHRELDGERLRALSTRQHQVVAALARQAGELTARAGRRISEGTLREVEGTLHAVLADSDAARQWATGRLSAPLAAPAGLPPTAEPTGRARTGGAHRGVAEPAGSDADVRGRERREGLARARRQARDAERDLHAREQEERAARRELSGASQQHEDLRQQIADLTTRLARARDELRQARRREREARERARRADREVDRARSQVEEAARTVERLSGAPGAATSPGQRAGGRAR